MAAVSPARFKLKQVNQVSVITRDYRRTIENYWKLFGVGPWKIYTYGPPLVKDCTYMGQPAVFHMKICLAPVGDFVYEVIQPLDGPNVYQDFLDRCGEGVQHVGFVVPNLEEAVAEATAAGFKLVQSGRGYGKLGDGGFAYLGTEEDLGVCFEMYELPKIRVEPEEIYPER